MSAQVNLVAVKDGKILDSLVLTLTVPEARQSFITHGNASDAYNAQGIVKALTSCYTYHSKHTVPFSKYDARSKQEILKTAFVAYMNRITQADGELFSFSDMKIADLVKPMEERLKYMDKAETIHRFNYVSDCMTVEAWMQFVERNQENDFHIVVVGDIV